MEATNNQQKFEWVPLLKKYGIIIVLILMIIGISIARPIFLSPSNIFNVLTQSSIFGIMALGITLVIISKGIDLSLGSVLALAGVIAASFAQTSDAYGKYFPNMPELPFFIPMLIALGIGVICCGISGWLVAYTGIPAFIATLGMVTVARGLALIYTGGRPISSLTSSFIVFGQRLGVLFHFNVPILSSIPMPVVVYACAAAVTWILLNNTRFGKSVYAIGGNIKAAEVSGINVKTNLVLIYAYCGLLVGLAAIVFAGRTESVHPGAATGYELTAIAASTIGGTSHSGGIGTVWGAVVGALILGVLRNGLTLLGVHPYWQQVAEGVIIVVAVIIDMRNNAPKK
ncbi:MAG: ABC transporter permease [Planctomycetes bacterium]|nr:ABC transporter permease [Planctomycetota bacterium]